VLEMKIRLFVRNGQMGVMFAQEISAQNDFALHTHLPHVLNGLGHVRKPVKFGVIAESQFANVMSH